MVGIVFLGEPGTLRLVLSSLGILGGIALVILEKTCEWHTVKSRRRVSWRLCRPVVLKRETTMDLAGAGPARVLLGLQPLTTTAYPLRVLRNL